VSLRCDVPGGLTLAFVQVGADFAYRKNFHDLLEVKWMGGNSEMMEEEYAEGRYRHEQLRPETGGRYCQSWLVGAGYVRTKGRLY
jgi:hypothetical protein